MTCLTSPLPSVSKYKPCWSVFYIDMQAGSDRRIYMSSQTTCQGSQSLGGIRKAFKLFERFVCPPDTDTHRTAGGREGNDNTEQGRVEPANFQFYGFLVVSRDQAGPLHSYNFKMLLTPALLWHKDTAQGTQSPYCVFLS